MDDLREEVAVLKAQLAVQQMALRVLVHTHPDPAQVLDKWRGLQADRIAAAYGLPADVRNSEWLSQNVQACAEDWTAELVDAVTCHAESEAGGRTLQAFADVRACANGLIRSNLAGRCSGPQD